jgi:hypothetical protein
LAKEQVELDAETIVEKAFEYFEKFVKRNNKLDGVFLEGLDPADDGWVVSIGFDGKRHETSEPATINALAALSGYGQKKTVTVREIRHFYLDRAGNFKRLS